MTPDHDEVRILLGAFVLGGLDIDDRNTVDAHLAACAECRTELAGMAPIPALLRRLPSAERAGGPAAEHDSGSGGGPSLDELLRRVRAERRSTRGTRRRRVAAVAASLVLCTGIGLAVSQPFAGAPPRPSTAVVAAAGTSITGRATLTAKPWGTSLAVTLDNLRGSGPFALEVVSFDGTTERAAAWSSTPTTKVDVVGASSIPTDAIDAIRVVDRDGQLLAVTHPRG